jgi:alpha-galactosidase
VILTAALLCVLSPLSHAKPLKVFILAGQSNMEGPASIDTFDYSQMSIFRKAMAAPASMTGFKDNVAAVETASFWSAELAAIDEKNQKIEEVRGWLDHKDPIGPNADGKMTDEQKSKYMKKFEADLISPAEATMWKRGASNAGYHYLGCAKTFALMGKAFAEANLKMMKKP